MPGDVSREGVGGREDGASASRFTRWRKIGAGFAGVRAPARGACGRESTALQACGAVGGR